MADSHETKPVASKLPHAPSNSDLMARLEALEAKNHELEDAAEQLDPTYAPMKDSAEKSRYPEASPEVYRKFGLSGKDDDYASLDKVQAFYDAREDAVEGVKVTSYRVRAINDDVVVSYTLSDGHEKGLHYPNKK